jgi:hypothetical protein
VFFICRGPRVARDPHAARLDAWAKVAGLTRPPLDR